MGFDKSKRPIEEPGKDFPEAEIDTGAKWLDGSPIFRKTIDFGALPNAAAKDVAHGITGIAHVVKLEGAATDPAAGFTAALSLNGTGTALAMDDTNVTVTTLADLSAYTASHVIVEYTKA